VKAEQLETLLAEVAAGRLAPDAALERLRHLPFEDLAFARVDHHRSLRQGQPEVVFCEGKTPEQVVSICERLAAMTGSFLGTRSSEHHAKAVRRAFPKAVWTPLARTVHLLPEGANESNAMLQYKTNLEMRGGNHRIVVSVRDLATGRTGTAKADIRVE